METRDEAITELTARGFHAQRWDYPFAPGAFAVASEAVDIGDGIRLLKHLVFVPAEGGWSLRSEFPVGVESVPLAEAVEAAGALVSELRDRRRWRRLPAQDAEPERGA